MLRVVVDKSVSSALAKLTPDTQSEVLAELRRLLGAFGRPHIHAGLGMNSITPLSSPRSFTNFTNSLGLVAAAKACMSSLLTTAAAHRKAPP